MNGHDLKQAAQPVPSAEGRRVILASTLSTTFEWYDFFLYGALLLTIATNFFGDFPESTRNIFAILAFAIGFLVQPLGALLFGRLGDMAGRKYTFLVTILIMGTSTFLVGCLPTSETIGITAAVLLLLLRCLQGLALGGESGGAALFVAEHAPRGRRGFHTGFVQLSAALGMALALIVIQLTQAISGEDGFAAWGWRVPFLISIVLLPIRIWIRLRLPESPAFVRARQRGALSRAPVAEAFGRWRNARIALLALLGLVAGQAVVTYTGLFYPLFFLTNVAKVDGATANSLVIWALLIGAAPFVLFGWLSDKVGRKPVILGGCLLAAVGYFPLFEALSAQANPELHRAQQQIRVQVVTDRAACSFQFNPTGTAIFFQPCDIAKMALGYLSMPYDVVHEPGREVAAVRIADGQLIPADSPTFARDLRAALTQAGYPSAQGASAVRMRHAFDLGGPQVLGLIGTLALLTTLIAMVFGPVATALAELFPTRIRYTGMSVPYQVGNGWFGGLLPAATFALNAEAGSIYFGLWYPVVIAVATALIGLLLLPETKDRDLDDDAAFEAAEGEPARTEAVA